MQVLLKSLLVVILSTVLISSCGPSRVAVRQRPVAPVIVRPGAPYQGAVWQDGEWRWRGRNYTYIQPRYVRPSRGRTWVPGHWTTSRRGDIWVKGRWR